jgi:hypothetical protein
MAKEWRRALNDYKDSNELTWDEFQQKLGEAGVERESLTLQGWLELDRAYPIAPRGFEIELNALWVLIQPVAHFKLDKIILACRRLRSLRSEASRVVLRAWKGDPIALEIEGISLDTLIRQLRKEVGSYEVEAITWGLVPEPMIGWWVSEELAARFEKDTTRPQEA